MDTQCLLLQTEIRLEERSSGYLRDCTCSDLRLLAEDSYLRGENSIVAFDSADLEGSEVDFSCSDLLGNVPNAIIVQIGLDGNISADPLFCGGEDFEYYLTPESPCAMNHSDCGGMGCYPVYCPENMVPGVSAASSPN